MEQWWTGNCSAGDLANHFRPACGAAITRWPFKLLWVRAQNACGHVCRHNFCVHSEFVWSLWRKWLFSTPFLSKPQSTWALQGYPGDNRTVLPPDQTTISYPAAAGGLMYSVRPDLARPAPAAFAVHVSLLLWTSLRQRAIIITTKSC